MEAERSIERIASPYDFVATAEKMESVLRARGLTIFGKIDFSGDAERAGLKMPPTQMLIFGNPKAGTPLMVAAPTSALDLPLKVLISQDPEGKTWLSYNAPEYLAQRHNIPPELLQNIAGIRALVQAAAA
jgi:uncharacterized protein (DUF302 family)